MGKAKGGGETDPVGGIRETESDNLKGRRQGRGPLFRLPSMSGQSNFTFVASPCRHKHLRSLGYTLTPTTSALRERFPVSSEISKAFRWSVKQLHHDFFGRPRRYLLLPLTRLPCSKSLGRRSSCRWRRKPTNRSRHRQMVVSTLSHPVMARVVAYDNGWSERWLIREPTHRRRSRWCWVRSRPYSQVSSVQVLHPYSRASRTSASSIRTFSAIGMVVVGRS